MTARPNLRRGASRRGGDPRSPRQFLQARADHRIERGFGAEMTRGGGDRAIGVAARIAEIDERRNSLARRALGRRLRGTERDAADLVLELIDDALRELW